MGRKQLDLIATISGVGTALVVPNDVSRSLCKRGLMEATGGDHATGGFVVVTARGYRALADAIDAGELAYRPDWEAIRKARGKK